MILSGEEIRELIQEQELVSGFIELERQLQPNGFDLTVSRVLEFRGPGTLDFSNKERKIPETKLLEPDLQGFVFLPQGVYKVQTNEIIKMPSGVVAFCQTRSSLLRMGASTSTGFWDSGFCGRSEFVLSVMNPKGIKLKKDARVAQIVFLRMSKEPGQGYSGVYQNTK